MTTRDTILEACVGELRQNDEAAFRVAAVAKTAGCATSVLYHYFGSRDGLIDAGLIAIVTEETESLRAFVRLATEATENTNDAIQLMVDYATFSHASARRANRSMRARLLGASQTRPAVREAFQVFGTLVASTNEFMIRTLMAKGLLRQDLDVAAVGLLMRAMDYGWVLDEINDVPHVDFDNWIAVVRALATALAVEPSYLPSVSAV